MSICAVSEEEFPALTRDKFRTCWLKSCGVVSGHFTHQTKCLRNRCSVLTNSSNISKTSQWLTAVEPATQYVSCLAAYTVGCFQVLACVFSDFLWFCLGHRNFKYKCKLDLSCLISFSFQICIFSFHFGSSCTKRGRMCGFRSDERGLFSTKVKFGIFGSLNTEHVS